MFSQKSLVEYSDAELVERYRFDSAGIHYLEGLIGNELMSGSRRNCAISPLQNILLTLRFLATGIMQLCNGDDMGVSQPTISRAITATLRYLSSPRICAQFIKLPLNLQEIRKNQEEFFKIAGFPGIVEDIDSTHVQIIAPSQYENEYVYIHYYHSINTQVIFEPFHKIIDVVAKLPGSRNDARILNESGLKSLFDQNKIPVHTHLLGDSGYPSKRWLLTPFLRRNQGCQTNYNKVSFPISHNFLSQS